MQVETMGDVMDWTRAVHANMAECLEHCSRDSRRERVKMLLDYLAKHEHQLDHVYELSKEDVSRQALDTWCQEFFEKAPVRPHEKCSEDFRDRDTGEILAAVVAMHDKLIEFYRYMVSRAEVTSTRELLQALLDLEEHEAMRMARDGGRLEDL